MLNKKFVYHYLNKYMTQIENNREKNKKCTKFIKNKLHKTK